MHQRSLTLLILGMSLVAFLQITSVVGKDYEDEEHVEEEEAADSAENEEDDESRGEI